jgi:hypothetical protein
MIGKRNWNRLRIIPSATDWIRAAHRLLAKGEPVYRWQGPNTPFADPGDLLCPTTSETVPGTEVVKIAEHQLGQLVPLRCGRAALLWDKSFLWGYMAVCTLRDLGFSFDLLTAADVHAGALPGYQLLVVPGGWASLKYEELGSGGMEQIRLFVKSGGGYLGLCGGAGLALQVDEGLGLAPASRKPMVERLPNFSGTIRVHRTSRHPIWWGLDDEASFQVWWPSQFKLLEPKEVLVLGKYGEPEKDFCVSDLNVQDTETAGFDWDRLEEEYEINLDPRRLLDEPAVIECTYGQGRVVLSYPHLETPGDAPGNVALFNLWYDLLRSSPVVAEAKQNSLGPPASVHLDDNSLELLRTIVWEAGELIVLGESCHLWSWRNPWLLQWRRGVRGSEFGTVCVMLQGLLAELERCGVTTEYCGKPLRQRLELDIRKLGATWSLFRDKGRALLESEANDMNGNGENGSTARLRALRVEIFSCAHCYGSRSYGGLYRRLLDQIDSLLLSALLATVQQ